MTLAETLRELIAWKDTPKYQRAYQNESMWINARAALAAHDAQQQEGPCKAGGPCRFRGYASPEFEVTHAEAQQQEVNSKSRLKRLAVQQQYTCIGRDPLCPCQDGLACHYKDAGKTKAFPIQE
jgi:hypothetical protein